jgi:RimJ/RimL family protein N-acetyltransferase
MIKVAERDDLPVLMELAKGFYEESSYSHLEWNEEKVYRLAEALLDKPDGIVLLSDDTAMIAGMVSETLFSDDPIATELMWYCVPKHRGKISNFKLLKAFEYWGLNKMGCSHVSMSLLLNDKYKKLKDFFDKKHYVQTEQTFLRSL